MSDLVDESRQTALLVPSLQPLYQVYDKLYWPLIRLAAGGLLFVHGYMKLVGPGLSGTAAMMAHFGLRPAMALGAAVIFIETVGAICIVLGLFTRFFAAAICIEFVTLLFATHGRGWELPVLWGLVMAAIAMRGGGPLSLDQKIGREL